MTAQDGLDRDRIHQLHTRELAAFRAVARRERAADFADSGRRAAATASITDLGTWVSAAPSR